MNIKILPIGSYVRKFFPDAPIKHWFGIEEVDGKVMIYANPDHNQLPGTSLVKKILGPVPENMDWVWVHRISMTTAKLGNTDAVEFECGAYIGEPEAIGVVKKKLANLKFELEMAILEIKELLAS